MVTFNFRQDTKEKVESLQRQAQFREELKQKSLHYKLIADLLAGKSIDLTLDPQMFAHVNRERLSLEEYMSFFPQEVNDALAAAADRRNADEKDYNPKSPAKWRCQGFMPNCVNRLFTEVYQDREERGRAVRRFFNHFPKFRISHKAI